MNFLAKYAVPRRAPRGARGLKFYRGERDTANLCRRAPRGARGLKYARAPKAVAAPQSRPARGAWIEIKGLKLLSHGVQSRPARGAWIEIQFLPVSGRLAFRRAPRGARGLKLGRAVCSVPDRRRRAPRGARGLKSASVRLLRGAGLSRPARGAWIEMWPP